MSRMTATLNRRSAIWDFKHCVGDRNTKRNNFYTGRPYIYISLEWGKPEQATHYKENAIWPTNQPCSYQSHVCQRHKTINTIESNRCTHYMLLYMCTAARKNAHISGIPQIWKFLCCKIFYLIFNVKIFSWSRIPTKMFCRYSTFPGLVIWNETMHAKKTWPARSCGQTTHVWKRTKKRCRHVLWQ